MEIPRPGEITALEYAKLPEEVARRFRRAWRAFADQRATTSRGYPYPLRSWPPDAAIDIQNLAAAVNTDVADNVVKKSGDTMSGDLSIVRTGASHPALVVDGDAATQRMIRSRTNGVLRWTIRLGNATAETGSNTGSDFELVPYSDAAAVLVSALVFNRATGLGTVKGDPTAALGIATKQFVEKRAKSGTLVGTTDTFGDLNVSFGFTFPSAPLVVASLGDALPGQVSVAVLTTTITTTGCKVRLLGNNAAPIGSTSTRINWIAALN